jgi:uncharacterized protein (DUF924 family)
MRSSEVLAFWFDEIEPHSWWVKSPDFDQMITARFADIHRQAVQGELSAWRQSPKGRLAEILLLDQFSRNIFRDTAQAFAYDLAALILAQEAVVLKCDSELTSEQRSFLYMPFMHSESRVIHSQALLLFTDLPNNLDFELRHKEIIDRFGRYPHRNAILGRKSTDEEIAFLKEPGSSF